MINSTRFFITILILLFCFSLQNVFASSAPSKEKSDLESYYAFIRRYDPYAIITGGFSDWRTVSVYRRQAGYHLGYDIALPAGFLVPSGWSGKVVSVEQWASNEWGISILLDNGYIVTLGHLSPTVSIGDKILPGMIVGSVAIDHVDIKIKDNNGNYIDFGKTKGLVPLSPDAVFLSGAAIYLDPAAKAKIIKAKQQELALRTSFFSIMTEYLKEEKQILLDAESELEKMKKLKEEDLISASKLKEAENDLKTQKEEFANIQKGYDFQKKRIEALRKELKAYNAKELAPKKEATNLKNTDKERLKQAQEKAEKYKRLYADGAVSKSEKDDADKEYLRMKNKLILKANEEILEEIFSKNL